jgi:hypothetical protein
MGKNKQPAYKGKFTYAENIGFADIINCLEEILKR